MQRTDSRDIYLFIAYGLPTVSKIYAYLLAVTICSFLFLLFLFVTIYTQKAQDLYCYLSCDLEALGLPIFVRYKQHRAYAKKVYSSPIAIGGLYTQRRHLLLHALNKDL